MAIGFAGGTDRLAYGNLAYSGNRGAHGFWMRTTQTTTDAAPLTHIQAANTSGMAVLLNNTPNKLTVQGRNGAGTIRLNMTTATSVNDGNWHHILIDRSYNDGEACRIYVDGVLDVSVNVSGGNWTFGASAAPYLGDSNVAAYASFVGDIAEVGIWDRRLTLAEIEALAKGAAPPQVALRVLDFYAPLVRESRELCIGPATVTGTSIVDHPRVFGGMT